MFLFIHRPTLRNLRKQEKCEKPELFLITISYNLEALIHVTLEPGGQDTQDVIADLALYLGSKLKLKQEEGLNR